MYEMLTYLFQKQFAEGRVPYSFFTMFCLDEVVADGEKGIYKDCTVDRAPLRYKSIMYNQECSTTENNVILLKLLTLK